MCVIIDPIINTKDIVHLFIVSQINILKGFYTLTHLVLYS